MEKVFWLREGLLAGRSGPNLDPWDLETFKKNGFSAILSVNDGEMVHESLIESLGLNYANIPMSSNAPVQPGDKELCLRNLPKAMKFLGENLRSGPVLVHCRSGKDRTGLVLAASLIAIDGAEVDISMSEVLKVREIAFSADGWMSFSKSVLEAFYLQNKSMLSDSLSLASN